jgi:WD40 repeat protein
MTVFDLFGMMGEFGEMQEDVRNKVGVPVYGIAFSGTRVLYNNGMNVTVLDITTKKMIDTMEIGSTMSDLKVCEDGRTLLVACWDNTGRVVDLQTKKSVILKSHTRYVTCIIECGDRDVLTCSEDKTICRWNRLTGELIRTYSGHSGPVSCILFNRETNVVFSGSGDSKIFLWNSESGKKIGEITGHHKWVSSLAFVNATTIVSGSADKTVKIWDITTKKEIKTMSSHSDTVRSVAVTPEGQHVVSGSWDKTVKVWSIATGKCITTLSHHSGWVNKVAVSPDGRFIASGGYDDIFYLLAVAPPFSYIVHEELLALPGKDLSDHSLLSDGSLLQGDTAVCSITPSTSCSLDTESHFTLKNHQSSSGSSNNNANSVVTLCASTTSSALQWIEAIYAVRHTLSLQPNQRSNTFQKILSRYRFDLLQTISIVSKRSNNRVKIPKDVMLIIGNYIVGL